MDFCGQRVVCDLTDAVSFTKYGRELDDDSELEITVHLTGDAAGDTCCECISNTRTWRNELMITRDGEPIWGPGPIVNITIQREIAHLIARDVVAWLDVRAVHTDYTFDQVDLATIAQTVIVDALTLGPAASLPPDKQDACILGLASFSPTGKPGDLVVKANTQTAGEVLRELAQSGLDFTVVKRSLIVGANFAFGPIGPLRDEDFMGDLEVTEHGLAAATKWYESGAPGVSGTCGGVDPYFGLIERAVEGQSNALTSAELNRMACERLAISNPPPLTVNVPPGSGLSPNAAVCPEVLVPGTLVDLDIQELCRPAIVRQRITAVEFRSDDNGELVAVTIAPQGGVVEETQA